MNLEELKIKISIELKELDKQLNSISKSIDKTLGSKATKKLMQSNHKVIKAESKLINKTLNDAFEVDFTKFNNGLAKTMNQAKRTVQQTCREIRNELNNALNGSGSITVTGKASVSRTPSSQNSANNAAIVQSSQYVGAMITKAVNEMIKANNANTGRIETALKEVINAIGKLSINNNKQKNLRESDNTAQGKGGQTKTTNTVELIFDVKDSELQNEVDQAINRINVPNLEIPIDVDTSDIDKKIDVSNVSTVVSLEVDIDDSELQSKVEKAKNKISVPDVRIGTMLDDRNNIQNEVNKLVRETNIPELKVSFASIEEDGEKLQSTIYHIMKEMEVPELKIPFASINVKELESNINKAIKDIKVSQVEIPTSITKAESNTTESTTKIKRKPTPPKAKSKDNGFDSLPTGEDRLSKFVDDLKERQKDVANLISQFETLRHKDIGAKEKSDELAQISEVLKTAEKSLSLFTIKCNELEREGLDVSRFVRGMESLKEMMGSLTPKVEDLREQLSKTLNEANSPIKIPEVETPVTPVKTKRKPTPPKKNKYDNELLVTPDVRPKKPTKSSSKSYDNEISVETPQIISVTGQKELQAFIDKTSAFNEKLQGFRKSISEMFSDPSIGLEDKLKGLEQLRDELKRTSKLIGIYAQKASIKPTLDTKIVKSNLNSLQNDIISITAEIKNRIKDVEKAIKDFNELSITIDDDGSISHIFENLSEALTKAAEESSKKINKMVSELKGMDSIDLGDAPQNTDTSSLEEAVRLESEITREQSKQQGVRKSIEHTLDTIKNDLEQIRDVSGIELDIDFSSKYFADSIKHLRDGLIEIKELGFEDSVELPDGTIFDSNTLSECIDLLGKVEDGARNLKESDLEVTPKIEIDQKTMESAFKFLEHFVKQAEAQYESNPVEVPIEFALVNQGAMNLRKLMDLPQFKEDAQAISDYLRGIDFADELELDIGVDQLTEKLKNLQSIDDIDIDLEDLRRDIVLLLEKADQMRSTMDDEIIIKVIDDEVSKITDLLKLLDSIREKYHVKVDVDVDSSESSEAT